MEQLTCENAEILLNLRLDGLLHGAEAARLDTHLAACPACRATWAELEALDTTLATLSDAPVPPVVLSGVLARVPAPAPTNGLARWRWPLGLGLALETAIAALLLWLNWSLVRTFVQSSILTAALAERAAGHHLADGIGAWGAWFGAQAALAQTQWQALVAQVSSLAPATPEPEAVVQALVLLVAVLLVWGIGNRFLAAISIQYPVSSNQ